MPTLTFIDGTSIHVEFRFHVCLKFFVNVRLVKRSFKALAEIVVYYYRPTRNIDIYGQ